MLDRGVWPQRSCPAGSVGSARSFIARCTSRGAHLDLVFTGPLQLGRTQASRSFCAGSTRGRWCHDDASVGVSPSARVRKWYTGIAHVE